MPYALVPIVDIGPSSLPWCSQRRQPLGLDQGGHCIHLGNDHALLWTPSDVTDARVAKLAESVEETAAAATRTVLNTLRQDARTVGAVRVGDALADLLINPPRGLWNALVATRDGRLQVRLGPGTDNVIWSQRVAPRGPASKDIQDTFNRTSDLHGSTTSDAQTTWVEDQGTAWTVDGDEADITGNVSFCVGRLALAMDTADHYVQADLSRFSLAGGQLSVGVMLRADATPTSGYAWELNAGGTPGNKRRVYNFVSDTDVASDGAAPSLGLIYLEFDGGDYVAKLAGATIFSGTDTTFPGTTVKGVGIQAYSVNNAANTCGLTSFRAADLGAPPAEPTAGKLTMGLERRPRIFAPGMAR